MRLRILLPPNLESCAPRDAIPVKLEIQTNEGAKRPPEKVPLDQLGELHEQERLVAFALLQWGGGALTSFVQLSREQVGELVARLVSIDAFFWVNRPNDSISWNGAELIGVSEFLDSDSNEPKESKSAANENATRRPIDPTRSQKSLRDYQGTPMIVDGSTQFLAISLPSKEHPYYQEIRDRLESYRFKLEPRNRRWWLRDRHQTLNFLGEFGADLEERYCAEFTDNFIHRAGKLKKARIRTEVVEESNGYAIALSLSAGEANSQAISRSLNAGRRYIESGDRVFLIDQSSIDSMHTLQKSLSGSPDAPLLHHGSYKVTAAQAPEIEDALSEINPNFKPPSTWRARSAALRDLSKLAPTNLSPTLQETLRPYQLIGASWLRHLYDHQLGGILADEMGLGKTLQALALLDSLQRDRRASGPPLSLVVCPASLVENWRREAARFCPQLAVFVNHGTQRIRSHADLREIDLVITSYGTLLRDEDAFSSLSFNCVIGDEAQSIKNRRARNAQAISKLATRGRFLLTGTPVENSIQDLISLLDFILPGGIKGIPQGARGDDRIWHEQRIKDQAGPYILRRSKESVAPELPEKIEQVVFVQMTERQKQVYDHAKRQAENEIAAMESKQVSEGSIRMKTLTQLLRLRQTCCDPRLLDAALAPEDSSKRASFLELLREAIDGQHRILVFSQFVSILSLLKEELEAAEIDYCYIDGATRNRMDQVDRFQSNPQIPLFLISLKAGGTGLNLTAADTVIHFDPWWNPAAEAQATDRAHRIGQTKVVTSYKLIVADSVEEKVLRLQGEKRKLLADVFEASDAANASLRLSDLKDLL